MLNLWPHLERVSALLEPDERQQVLGDIHEQGATFRSLVELYGLIFARQRQAWATWRPWMLSVALFTPSTFVVFSTIVLIRDLLAGRFVIWSIIGIPVLAFAMGFSLSSLGKRRTLSVVPMLAVVLAWLASNEIIRLLDEGTYAAVLLFISMTGLISIPFLYGLRRGFNPQPLSITVRTGLLILGSVSLTATIIYYWPVTPSPVTWLLGSVVTIVRLWPVVYVFRRNENVAPLTVMPN